MIKNIGIDNFRVFQTYSEFELSPITLLTGPNNSGKSSFLKFVQLLEHSFKNGIEKLNFDGGSHNLGSFDKVLNWDSSSKELTITLDFPLNHLDEKFKLELIYIINYEDGILCSFKIFNNTRVLFRFILDYGEYDIVENNGGFSHYTFDIEYLKKIISKIKSTVNESSLFFEYYIEDNKKQTLLNKKFHAIFSHYESNFGNKFYPIDVLGIDNFEEQIEDIPNLNMANIIQGYYLKMNEQQNQIEDIELQVDEELANEFLEILPFIKVRVNEEKEFNKLLITNIEVALKKIKFSFSNFYHISAFRGSKKRVLSNVSENEIDEIVKDVHPIIKKDSRCEHFLDNSLKLLKIEGKIEIERLEGVSSIVYLNVNDKRINLSDLGYGYSQLLPIIFKIIKIFDQVENQNSPYKIDDLEPKKRDLEPKTMDAKSTFIKLTEDNLRVDEETNYPTLVVEEPEANLHPNLQSKLADILVLAHKTFNVHFILETHSEYFIRKLQYLTAKKEVAQDDVTIYYFNSDEYVNENEPKVKQIQITEFGGLTDTFGPGFFDEAIQLQFDLLKLNRPQEN